MKKRKNPASIVNLLYNDYAHTQREMEGGFPVDMSKLGSMPATEILVGKAATVRISNGTAKTIYVATGATSMAAPTGMSSGIAVFSGQVVFINTADQEYIRFDSADASVQYAVAKDDSNEEG